MEKFSIWLLIFLFNKKVSLSVKLGQNTFSPRICLKYNICKIENFMILSIKYIFFDIIQSNHGICFIVIKSTNQKSFLIYLFIIYLIILFNNKKLYHFN